MKKDRFDRWMKELSPSKELLRAYKSGEKTWAAFESEFQTEMKNSPEAQKATRLLRKESRAGRVTILCYEKEGERCHRHIVAEMIAKPGRSRRLPTDEAQPAA